MYLLLERKGERREHGRLLWPQIIGKHRVQGEMGLLVQDLSEILMDACNIFPYILRKSDLSLQIYHASGGPKVL